MSKRTDIHSPSNFDGTQYRSEGIYDSWYMDSEEMSEGERRERARLEDILDASGFDGNFSEKGKCDHCGTTIRWACVFVHTNGEAIVTGTTCADRMGLTVDQMKLKLAQAAAEARDSARKNKKFRTRIESEDPTLFEFLSQRGGGGFVGDVRNKWAGSECRKLSKKQLEVASRIAEETKVWFAENADIVSKLVEISKTDDDRPEALSDFINTTVYYGLSLTDGQKNFALTLIDEIENGPADPAGDAPVGKGIEISGEVIKTDEKYNDYGVRYVMTVKTENGSLVWGSIPNAISEAKTGDVVSFTANFEASDKNDFSFFKRPRKAAIVDA